MEKLSIREQLFYRLIFNERRVYQHWYTRFLLAGVDLERCRRVVRRTKSWFDWCQQWRSEGVHLESLAERALAQGSTETARALLHEAVGCFHVGQHFFYIDGEQKAEALAKVHQLYPEALALAPAKERPERLEIPFRGATIPAYLWLQPAGRRGDAPLVILVNGMDNLKETEQDAWARILHRRGYNVVAFDGPGQGEMWREMKMIPDYHRAVSAIIDWLEERRSDDIDLSRIATLGFSLGGYLAPAAAAHDRRVCCAVGNGGPAALSLLPEGARMNPVLARGFCHITGAPTLDQALDRLGWDIRQAPPIDRPLLIFHSGGDRLIPEGRRHAELFLAQATSEKELRFYPEGEHVCADYLDEVIPLTVDWLGAHLRGGSEAAHDAHAQ